MRNKRMNYSQAILFSFTFLLSACSSDNIGNSPNDNNNTGGNDLNIAQNIIIANQTFPLLEHPRIFIGADMSLAQLRAKATDNNAYWLGFRDHMLNKANSGDFPNYLAGYYNAHEMAGFALMYLVDPLTYRDMGTAAIKMMRNFTNKNTVCDGSRYCGNITIDFGRHDLRKIAYAWDWTYDLLTADDKRVILEWVNNELFPIINRHPENIIPSHNLMHTHLTSLLAFALATYEDNGPGNYDNGGIIIPIGNPSSTDQDNNPYQPKTIANNSHAYLEWAYQGWFGGLSRGEGTKYFVDNFYTGGHSYSGSAYSYNRSTRYMFYNLMLFKSALNIDLWPESVNWSEAFIDYSISTTLPNNTKIYSDGNVGGDRWDTRNLEPLNIALHHYGAENNLAADRGYYFLNNIIKPSNNGSNANTLYLTTAYRYKWFLWLEPNKLGTDYSNSLTTTHISTGTDLFQSRTSWNDTDASWLGFSASPWIGDHQGKNYGSYKLFKNQHLIYENGNDANASEANTNIIRLDDGIVKRWYGQLVTTGGLRYTGDHALAPIRANITKSYSLPTASYAQANLWDVYVKNPSMDKIETNNYLREIVHLKPGSSIQDYTIVYDRIKTKNNTGTSNGTMTNTQVKKTNTYHVPASPVISTTEKTVAMIAPSNSAKLITKVLLPANANIIAIDTADNVSTGDDVWRVEINNPNNLQYERFLLLHMPTTTLTDNLPTINILSSTVNVDGLHLDTSTNSFVVAFNNNEAALAPPISISYSINTNKITTHYVHGLAAGTYEVIDPISGRFDVSTNSGDSLIFNSDSNGLFTLQKR